MIAATLNVFKRKRKNGCLQLMVSHLCGLNYGWNVLLRFCELSWLLNILLRVRSLRCENCLYPSCCRNDCNQFLPEQSAKKMSSNPFKGLVFNSFKILKDCRKQAVIVLIIV